VLSYSIPFVYPINPPNNNIPKTTPYYNGAGYLTAPTMISSNVKGAEAACTVGVTQDGIVVAFRGTVYNSFYDWENDLLLEAVTVAGIPGKVHEGFNDAVAALFAPLLQQVITLKNAYPGYPLYFTGHSKGGGMAPIAAYYFFNKGIRANGVYLFAPPLPGTAPFATAYNARFPNTFLYENYLDIVPLMPPSYDIAVELDTYLAIAWAEGRISKDWVAFMLVVFGFAWIGYTPVGSPANTYFIRKPVNGVYSVVPMTNSAMGAEQIMAIGNAIISDDFSAIANAHNSRCNHGYMNALSGSICPVKL
jgi:hypothetical protein